MDQMSRAGMYAQGYADDLTVDGYARDASTASSLARGALNLASKWCREIVLKVNPEKTEIVRFTWKRRLEG